MRKIKLLILFICAAFNVALSQTITQTVKGKVYDSESQAALPGASVVVLNTNPGLGNIADVDGLFKITGVPIGRYNIQVSFLGYETVIIPEILVSSGKEVVLNISLKQSVTQMDEVKVKAFTRKDRPLNTMAAVSARSFTVEETRRYAGGLDDPARMASAFAGVTVGSV
ncbi:MAG TPA: carboxypeptidase-like regulatory domain-containing protein, partial [Bacteroidales bacterium]